MTMSHSNQTIGDSAAGPSFTPTVKAKSYVPRASRACMMCRLKKAKCDQQNPCSYCQKHSVDCLYSNLSRRDEHGHTNEDKLRRASTRARKEGRIHRQGNSEPQGQQPDPWNGSPSTVVPPPPRGSEELWTQTYPAVGDQNVVDHTEEALNEDPDPDIVGDINRHTSGTEFYGMSSNFVLLNQLFSRARLHASDAGSDIASNFRTSHVSPTRESQYSAYVSSPDHVMQDPRAWPNVAIATSSHLSAGRLSIVNLLYNGEASLPPSRPKTPIRTTRDLRTTSSNDTTTDPNSRGTESGNEYIATASNEFLRDGERDLDRSRGFSSGAQQKNNSAPLFKTAKASSGTADKATEREYVRGFFDNLHHLHPFLLVEEFTSRCEQEIWNTGLTAEPQQERKHFLALYNIVVAVGALIAATDVLPVSESEVGDANENDNKKGQTRSSMALSLTYFRKSRMLLGDVFEVCSLDSAQALFLMSLYCQNALKPHSCYMYSGMAVRTALAIGLPSESMSKSMAARKAARRTWWCIYSHEIDMCCSSGRRDSLRKPGSYPIPFPRIRDQDGTSFECEAHNISMVNEMVRFAIVLRKTSKDIYHDSKGLTLFEKSARALELDAELMAWKRNLPAWLDLESSSLREPVWASKQKLVLQLRYLNARILLHRPFLACVATQNVVQLEANIDPCLDAARKTIYLMYESYAHRHYFRTWWYNSTYTLYAGMILLYIILLNYDKVPGEELLRDVEKSHEILHSMEEVSVARRSADLMLEVIEVAKTYLSQRRLAMQQLSSIHRHPPQLGMGGSDERDGDGIASSKSQSDHWQRTLFAEDFLGLRRVDMLSTLIDPSILGDFAAENTYPAQNELFVDLGNQGPLGMWGSM